MHAKTKTVLRCALAVLVSLVLLDIFCWWYYNPAAYVATPGSATDLIREPGAFTSRAKEGIAWARMDENGYNNPDVPGEGDVFVLMMGTSHAEALNVSQGSGSSALLEELLHDAGMGGRVYNIGVSSHTLPHNAANFANALRQFRPSGYVVLETPYVLFFNDALNAVLDGTLEPVSMQETSLPGLLKDRPLLKALYRQFVSLAGTDQEEGREDALADVFVPADILGRFSDALTAVFSQMAEAARASGVKILICYHPHLLIQEDGSALPATNPQCLEVFARACARTGIEFVDMTGRFLEAYQTDHILPHGFLNTPAGTGHLNKDGHRMIAEALFEVMMKQEAKR